MSKATDSRPEIERWTGGRLASRSGFYTGRGPSSSDLSSQILELIYRGIKAEVGKVAATNFARFVANLKDLSASAFIQAFERFWYGGCKQVVITQNEGSGHRMTGDSKRECFGEGFVLVAEGLSGSRARMSPDAIGRASQDIKRQFVAAHRAEIPAEERDERNPYCSPLGSW